MWCLIAIILYNEDDDVFASGINDDGNEHEGKTNTFLLKF